MEEATVFQYQPFSGGEEDATWFRLLSLRPGSGEEPLVGEVHHIRLDLPNEVPAYEALSYCCGDASEVARITLGPKSYLPLGHNLFKAIQQLRSSHETRVVWIDAICINQNDLDERAHEVQLMHRIYQHAQKVLVWLDEPAVRTKYWNPKLAFAMATQLAKLHASHPDIDIHSVGRLRKAIVRYQSDLSQHKIARRLYLKSSDALRLLFTRPWFERMWVVQEVSCSTYAIVICGENIIDFRVLMQGFEFGLRSGLLDIYRQRRILLPMRVTAPVANISAAMAMYTLTNQELVGDDLMRLLTRFHGSKSSDPRDKLFALYGISSLDHMDALASGMKAIGILPDYHTDAAELYIKVARGILRTSQNLDLFSIPCQSTESKTRIPGLPSWVPDWSFVDKDTAAISATAPNCYSTSASSKHVVDLTGESNLNASGETVTISGYFFDRIAETGVRSAKSPFKTFNQPDSAPAPVTILVIFLLWIEQAVNWEFDCSRNSKVGTYLTGEDMVDVYWKILLTARNQFEMQWFISQHENHNIRPSRLSRWCSRRLEELPKLRNRHFKWAYYTTIFLSVYSRGLRRFGLYDEAIVRSRTIARTEQGYIGLVPAHARPGDSIAICRGGKTPLVIGLRDASSSTNSLKLVGDAYIHGIMHGEAWDEDRCGPIVLT